MNTKRMIMIVLAMFCLTLFAEEIATPADPGFKLSQPREEIIESFMVAGLQVFDTMDSEVLSQVWHKFFDVYPQIPGAVGEVLYGITFFTEEYNPQEHTGYGYIVCTQVKDNSGMSGDIAVRQVPGGSYLVWEYTGPMNHFQDAFNQIFYQELPASKRIALYSDVLEIYGDGFDAESPDSKIEIWIPVKPLQ